MKTQKSIGMFLPTIVFLAATGCSSMGGTHGSEIAATGPTVLNVRVNPDQVELNQSLQPMKPVEIVADVKDFTSKVADVRLRFVHAPIEVKMRNIGGSTWMAQLTPEQLKMLAVSGQIMKYDANIVARDEDGMVATSRAPVTIAIKAPELPARA